MDPRLLPKVVHKFWILLPGSGYALSDLCSCCGDCFCSHRSPLALAFLCCTMLLCPLALVLRGVYMDVFQCETSTTYIIHYNT